MPLDQVQSILPMGAIVGGHVTPIDHEYYSPKDFNDPDPLKHDVIADGDGYVVGIEFQGTAGSTLPDNNRYRLTIEHSCTFYSIYNLLTQLDPVLAAHFANNRFDGRFKITSGQHLGKVGHRTLDYQLADTDVTLPGFVNPDDYTAEIWKVHTVAPLDYFAAGVKSQVLPLYVRQVDPRDGKIDWDQDGHLIGNWFKVGFPGYGGFAAGGDRYYVNHLAFVPDSLDPTNFHVSIGSWKPDAAQFSVAGNPDPSTVTPSSGLLKWRLVNWDYQNWDHMNVPTGTITAVNGNSFQGTVLVQMLDGRHVKFEAFPGMTPDQVSGFDVGATEYTR